jgi:RNA polymerase sigma factor (sigma-70 family)
VELGLLKVRRRLSAAEERSVVLAAKAGDEAAKEALFGSVLPFVVRALARFRFDGFEHSDLLQMAGVGFARALERFDPDSGHRFITYYSHWMTHEHRRYAEELTRRRRVGVTVQWPEDASPDGRRSAFDPPDPAPPVDSTLAARDFAERRLPKLTETEAMVIRMRFGLDGEDPRTLEEVATVLGLSRERVRQIEYRALQRMRDPVHRDH